MSSDPEWQWLSLLKRYGGYFSTKPQPNRILIQELDYRRFEERIMALVERMKEEMTTYIALIRKEEDSAYGIDFPDFPGCISSGASLHEAYHSAQRALALHIKGMEEDGDELPRPSTLSKVMEDDHNHTAIPAIMNVLPVIDGTMKL